MYLRASILHRAAHVSHVLVGQRLFLSLVLQTINLGRFLCRRGFPLCTFLDTLRLSCRSLENEVFVLDGEKSHAEQHGGFVVYL